MYIFILVTFRHFGFEHGEVEERQGHLRRDLAGEEGQLLLGVVLGSQIGARRQFACLCRSAEEVHHLVSSPLTTYACAYADTP